ncbi:MAG: hypothetical protein IJJ26_05720 [Victivallales bacterium]|nr:hypothetical protein [Victivallales bacterium]
MSKRKGKELVKATPQNLQGADVNALAPAPSTQFVPTLPTGREVATGTSEELQVFAKTVPPDIAQVLTAPPVADGHSPLQLIFAICFLFLLGVLVWHQFPRELPPPPPTPVVNTNGLPSVPRKDPLFALHQKANQLYSDNQYAECAELLNPHISDILKQQDHTHDRILAIFFDSVRKGVVPPSIRANAIASSQKKAEQNPDNIDWLLLSIHLKAQHLIDYHSLYANLQRGEYLENGSLGRQKYFNDLRIVRQTLSRLSSTIRARTTELDQRGDTRDKALKDLLRLRLVEAKLLTAQWMLRGGQGSARFPDDDGDPGVYDRERALQLTRHPVPGFNDNSQNLSIDFLWLRLFLANTVYTQAEGLFNQFLWNNRTHFSRSALKEEIERLSDRINEAEKREAQQ